jgi:ankyrin repeat protein
MIPLIDTPIHFAAKYGNKACLNVLLRIPSVDVNIINYGGNTALHIAATWGNVR